MKTSMLAIFAAALSVGVAFAADPAVEARAPEDAIQEAAYTGRFRARSKLVARAGCDEPCFTSRECLDPECPKCDRPYPGARKVCMRRR